MRSAAPTTTAAHFRVSYRRSISCSTHRGCTRNVYSLSRKLDSSTVLVQRGAIRQKPCIDYNVHLGCRLGSDSQLSPRQTDGPRERRGNKAGGGDAAITPSHPADPVPIPRYVRFRLAYACRPITSHHLPFKIINQRRNPFSTHQLYPAVYTNKVTHLVRSYSNARRAGERDLFSPPPTQRRLLNQAHPALETGRGCSAITAIL